MDGVSGSGGGDGGEGLGTLGQLCGFISLRFAKAVGEALCLGSLLESLSRQGLGQRQEGVHEASEGRSVVLGPPGGPFPPLAGRCRPFGGPGL